MEEKDISLIPLIRAKNSFNDALKQVNKNNSLERDGCIQRFEYCYELSWKMLKRFLKAKEIQVHGSKDTFRQSAIVGYIDSPEVWFDFLNLRNLTSHVYNEDTAEEVFNNLEKFQNELNKLVIKLQEYA